MDKKSQSWHTKHNDIAHFLPAWFVAFMSAPCRFWRWGAAPWMARAASCAAQLVLPRLWPPCPWPPRCSAPPSPPRRSVPCRTPRPRSRSPTSCTCSAAPPRHSPWGTPARRCRGAPPRTRRTSARPPSPPAGTAALTPAAGVGMPCRSRCCSRARNAWPLGGSRTTPPSWRRRSRAPGSGRARVGTCAGGRPSRARSSWGYCSRMESWGTRPWWSGRRLPAASCGCTHRGWRSCSTGPCRRAGHGRHRKPSARRRTAKARLAQENACKEQATDYWSGHTWKMGGFKGWVQTGHWSLAMSMLTIQCGTKGAGGGSTLAFLLSFCSPVSIGIGETATGTLSSLNQPPRRGLRFGNVALASHMVTFGCVSNVQAASDGQKKLASPFHAESPHGAVAAHFPHAPRARIA